MNATGNVYGERQGSATVAHSCVFNFNSTGIASGIAVGVIRASDDRPVQLSVSVQVATAFNAGTNNFIDIGTAAGGSNLLAHASVTAGTPGYYPASNAIAKYRATANTPIYVTYTQSGGVATTGRGVLIVHEFQENTIPISPSTPATESEESISSKGIGIMGTRGFARTSALASTSGKEAMVSYQIELPYGVSSGWVVPYAGFSDGTTDDIEVGGVIITAEEPDSDPVDIVVKFSGVDSFTVGPNEVIESDPISVSLLPGTALRVLTLYRNASGGLLPYQTWGFVTETHEGALTGNIGTLSMDDELVRGDTSVLAIWAGVAEVIRAYFPLVIAGRPHPTYAGTEVVVGFIGDSLNIQNNDYGKYWDGTQFVTVPFPTRGFNGQWAGADVPFVVFGQGGSNYGGFTGATGTALFQYLFGTGADDRKVTHIHDEYGINQIRIQRSDGADAEAVWTGRLTVAAVCESLGVPYIHSTLTPMTSDWMAGHANNGDAAAQFSHFISERAAFNDRVRSDSLTIVGCFGHVDWQDAVESDYLTNGNTWNTDTDGIHPGVAGHQAMATKISLATFAANPNPLPT